MKENKKTNLTDGMRDGMRSFEKEKIINILKLSLKNKNKKSLLTLNKLSERLGIKAEFLISPLKYLSDNDLIKVNKELNASEVDLNSYNVEITKVGESFINFVNDYL